VRQAGYDRRLSSCRGVGRPRLYSTAVGDVGTQWGFRPRRLGAVAGGRVRPRWPPRDERDL